MKPTSRPEQTASPTRPPTPTTGRTTAGHPTPAPATAQPRTCPDRAASTDYGRPPAALVQAEADAEEAERLRMEYQYPRPRWQPSNIIRRPQRAAASYKPRIHAAFGGCLEARTPELRPHGAIFTDDHARITCGRCRRRIKTLGLRPRWTLPTVPTFDVVGDFSFKRPYRRILRFTCPCCGVEITHEGGLKPGDGDGHRMSHCPCWRPVRVDDPHDGYFIREIIPADPGADQPAQVAKPDPDGFN